MFEGQSVDLGGLSKQEKIQMVSQQESMMCFFFQMLKTAKEIGSVFVSLPYRERVLSFFVLYSLPVFA